MDARCSRFVLTDTALANAGNLLKDVMDAVDANNNGKIEFEGPHHTEQLSVLGLTAAPEFCTFVEHAENELSQLFKSIDRDHNGKLDKGELGTAFTKAGISIDDAKLASFFDRIDANHDGQISFEEWR